MGSDHALGGLPEPMRRMPLACAKLTLARRVCQRSLGHHTISSVGSCANWDRSSVSARRGNRAYLTLGRVLSFHLPVASPTELLPYIHMSCRGYGPRAWAGCCKERPRLAKDGTLYLIHPSPTSSGLGDSCRVILILRVLLCSNVLKER